MKFLIDAQLPRRLANRLRDAGHDVRHTLDLPDKNRTSDGEINLLSEREQRIVITKDADFVNSFLISRKPYKLLLNSTGNIGNTDLEALVISQLAAITRALETYNYIEITRTTIVFHE